MTVRRVRLFLDIFHLNINPAPTQDNDKDTGKGREVEQPSTGVPYRTRERKGRFLYFDYKCNFRSHANIISVLRD